MGLMLRHSFVPLLVHMLDAASHPNAALHSAFIRRASTILARLAKRYSTHGGGLGYRSNPLSQPAITISDPVCNLENPGNNIYCYEAVLSADKSGKWARDINGRGVPETCGSLLIHPELPIHVVWKSSCNISVEDAHDFHGEELMSIFSNASGGSSQDCGRGARRAGVTAQGLTGPLRT